MFECYGFRRVVEKEWLTDNEHMPARYLHVDSSDEQLGNVISGEDDVICF